MVLYACLPHDLAPEEDVCASECVCWGGSGEAISFAPRMPASPDEKECCDARGGVATTQAVLLLMMMMMMMRRRRSKNSAGVVAVTAKGGVVHWGKGERCGGVKPKMRGRRGPGERKRQMCNGRSEGCYSSTRRTGRGRWGEAEEAREGILPGRAGDSCQSSTRVASLQSRGAAAGEHSAAAFPE
jgi:hypothetical protein